MLYTHKKIHTFYFMKIIFIDNKLLIKFIFFIERKILISQKKLNNKFNFLFKLNIFFIYIEFKN